ncbi:MAG: hypothetical protein NTW32_16555 [Chloroflexi bacterium]|nr:hypothetical protein [Chloroflexota bacterium]
MKIRIFPLILSAVLIAAHFLRSAGLLPVLFCLGAPLLLLIKRRWSLAILQFLSVVAALIWLAALSGIIQERVIEGRSWLASGIILGLVALFTLFSGWLLSTPQIKNRYPA